MRRNVSDCLTLPYHDDHFIIRWLKARNWDPVAAEKMLRASLKWREKWQADTIQDWPTPKVFEEYYPSGISGFDKEGSPVVILPFSGIDMWGMLHSVSKNDFIRMAIKRFEATLDLARKQAETHGINASKVVGILDMTGFNIKQFAWRPAAEAAITLIQMYEANYPEILKACYVINVSKVFFIAFSVVKNFLNDYTLSKIHIFKSEPHKWKPVILEQINADQLPVIYGGTMTDPDGNPSCPSTIKIGGKIPKSFYLKNQTDEKEEKTDDEYTIVTVKKGDKLRLDYVVDQIGSYLKWAFYTDGHDIKFGVCMKDQNGKEREELPINRVTCSQTEEEGLLSCTELGTYTVIFDNSYSFLRNKKLHYSISVLPPLETNPAPASLLPTE
ncbi:hypothetical protein O3M35_012950 [Rhynocoris fuscipes]|uniref:SEC14-like protein 2 n=1 Tax=Rhynocoris fuscipes TaxID=488301 RepID=A0AAW1CE92_9HEMI